MLPEEKGAELQNSSGGCGPVSHGAVDSVCDRRRRRYRWAMRTVVSGLVPSPWMMDELLAALQVSLQLIVRWRAVTLGCPFGLTVPPDRSLGFSEGFFVVWLLESAR